MEFRSSETSRRVFLACLGSAGLTACTVGPDFEPPTMDFPDQYPAGGGGEPVRRQSERWWNAFGDDTLNQIVDVGLRQNLDITAALYRVEQAKAIADVAGYPISGSARVSEGKVSESSGSQQRSAFGRAEASWKLDLFGELRREREAAGYNLDAAYADVDVARLLLVEEIATGYIDLRFAQELIRTNLRETASREQTLQATRELSASEGGSELDRAQAQALLDNTRAKLPDAQIVFQKSLNRVIALLGEFPRAPRPKLDRKAPQPIPDTRGLRSGVPADLVRNRPDVVRAERNYAEALALAGVAEAQIYPNFVLTGNVQVNYDLVLGNDLPSRFFRAGLDVPIFDLPERKARARAARARASELLEQWKEKVVLGVEEVQNALYALDNRASAVETTTRALASLRRVLDLAREGYVAGEVGFLQVLDAERAVLSSENALAEDRRNFALDFVSLNVALGGSFGPPSA